MKKGLAFLIMLISLLPFSLVANAAETTQIPTNFTKNLKVTSDSHKVFQSVQLKKNGDKQSIIIDDSRKDDGISEYYEVTVDENNGTYKAIKRNSLVKSNNPISSQKSNILTPLSTYSYTAHVRAHTYDPINIDCNWTELGESWSENSGSFSLNWRSLNTWDAQPTSAGTYWYYVWSHYNNDPLYFNSASAKHVNYNFGGGIFGTTYAQHWVYISPQSNGYYHWEAQLDTSGIAGNLLHIGVETY
jgi:hypothetical protein